MLFRSSKRDVFVNDKLAKKTLKTWNDWMIHIMNYCEDCRIQQPPSQCVDDFERLNKAI